MENNSFLQAMGRKELGDWGEKQASKYLRNSGYQILEKNYSCKLGEIDLIICQNDILIFVEVKTRRSINYGPPQAAVDYRKQDKIKKVALYYLSINRGLDMELRFDVISIMLKKGQVEIEHFENAF
ncbi:YraN family protein [Halocella sp. SP3-1]|uniref:YraN family protein n=1 Tax=Halocella sp. SP3-1 TaxID=2382161 RepID=UPI00197AB43E|nr:YraN family protein [Halocella sp. SP3-1]